MEDETEETLTPECPYCHDSSGECEHVLLDYDASFMEYLSGYLAYNSGELDELKSMIFELVQSAKIPVLRDGYLKNLWDYALENYVSDSKEIEFDETAYFNLIDQIIELYGGKSFHYKEEDGAPGYSSAYIIYFAEDPEETITQINSFIIDQLES
jgi:hypothetical protein